MAGAALDDIDCYFAWQAWHLWHWVGSGGALGQPWRRDAAAFCVAGVALRDIGLHFVWQAWHLSTHGSSLWVAGVARRGTYGTGLALVVCLVPRPRWDAAAFRVAGVALCDIHLHFVWQAWHLMTWIVTLRGRRGTYGTWLATYSHTTSSHTTCSHMDRHFAWQAWHGVALMALGWRWWRAWFPGRAGTPRRFAWQAWHFVTSTFTLCGRRGTCQHMDRHFAWQAWHLWHWVGSGGVLGSQAALGRRGGCVAGVALCDIHLHFVWQAWHLMTWIVTLRGRRGTYGTWLATYSHTTSSHTTCSHMDRHFAWQAWHGVALMALGWRWWRAWFPGRAGTPRRFAWQAWHFVTSTFTLCGRRGTCQHMDRHFAWQAWHLWHWVGSGGALGSQGWCCSIHAYIHTHIHTDIHSYIHAYIHTCMHACIHACTTYSYRSLRGCYCDIAGAV